MPGPKFEKAPVNLPVNLNVVTKSPYNWVEKGTLGSKIYTRLSIDHTKEGEQVLVEKFTEGVFQRLGNFFKEFFHIGEMKVVPMPSKSFNIADKDQILTEVRHLTPEAQRQFLDDYTPLSRVDKLARTTLTEAFRLKPKTELSLTSYNDEAVLKNYIFQELIQPTSPEMLHLRLKDLFKDVEPQNLDVELQKLSKEMVDKAELWLTFSSNSSRSKDSATDKNDIIYENWLRKEARLRTQQEELNHLLSTGEAPYAPERGSSYITRQLPVVLQKLKEEGYPQKILGQFLSKTEDASLKQLRASFEPPTGSTLATSRPPDDLAPTAPEELVSPVELTFTVPSDIPLRPEISGSSFLDFRLRNTLALSISIRIAKKEFPNPLTAALNRLDLYRSTLFVENEKFNDVLKAMFDRGSPKLQELNKYINEVFRVLKWTADNDEELHEEANLFLMIVSPGSFEINPKNQERFEALIERLKDILFEDLVSRTYSLKDDIPLVKLLVNLKIDKDKLMKEMIERAKRSGHDLTK